MVDQNEQNSPPIEKSVEASPVDRARSAYLGYAVLAHLTKESIEEGKAILEVADEHQADRLRLAFSSAAQVLMEIRGLAETQASVVLDSGTEVEADLIGVKAEALQHTIHWVGKRYLSSLVGQIEDVELRANHIPAIVNVLLEMRGQPKRVERRSLDIEKLLSMRFAGLSTEEIALELKTKPNRVKGAFQRFSDLVGEQSSIDERNDIFRNRLIELNLFESKHDMSDEELDAQLPPRVPKKPSTKPRVPRTVKEKPQIRIPMSQEVDSFVLHDFPEDLLPGETMAERRARLRSEENG